MFAPPEYSVFDFTSPAGKYLDRTFSVFALWSCDPGGTRDALSHSGSRLRPIITFLDALKILH